MKLLKAFLKTFSLYLAVASLVAIYSVGLFFVARFAMESIGLIALMFSIIAYVSFGLAAVHVLADYFFDKSK